MLDNIRWGREKAFPDKNQQTHARVAVAPIKDEEKGIKKQEATIKKMAAVLILLQLFFR